MGRILAIDYGTKRTGIAVTDPHQRIASPLETVPTHDLMLYLDDYVTRENVEALVVGRPLRLDGSDSQSMRPLTFFVNALRKRLPHLRVEWVDERFTSRMAQAALVEGGMKKSKRREKGALDKVSAALILQSYLDGKNNLHPGVL